MSRPSDRTFGIAAICLVLLLAGFVSGYASSQPDGLNKVAAEQGFDATEQGHTLANSPLASYAASWIENDRIATGVAGVVGVALVMASVGLVLFVTTRRHRAGNGAELADGS